MADTPYNSKVDKLPVSSRTGSATGDMIADQGDKAEDAFDDIGGERGEKYKQQARRQRLANQRMRQLNKEGEAKAALRQPRNAKFQAQEESKSPTLSYADIGFMAGVALIFDVFDGLLSLIPGIGNLVIAVTVFPAATLTLYLMYKKRGIEMKSTKTLIKFWGTLCISFIPILSILPEYVLNVVLISLEKKAEEKLNLK